MVAKLAHVAQPKQHRFGRHPEQECQVDDLHPRRRLVATRDEGHPFFHAVGGNEQFRGELIRQLSYRWNP